MSDSLFSGGHGAELTIDLSALTANWRLLRERAGAAECAGVVKADAYGIGIEQAVPALVKAGCRTFFVAHLSEARRLRPVAPDATVYILNGFPIGSAGAYREIDAQPVLGSLEELSEWRATGEGRPFALHVDTGLNRLGLTFAEFTKFHKDGGFQGLRPSLVLSHYVSSEDPADPITTRQTTTFAEVRSALPGVDASLSNSSGFFLAEPPRYSLMRLGYALYGGNPTPGAPNPMKPVVRLEALVMQVRQAPAGDTVGYNTTWTARRDTTIATISLGYADGWFRSQSGTDAHPGGIALVHGAPCPIVGRVSMDLITLDITDLPQGVVKRGDKAVLIGDGISIDDVAKRAGTNGYEVLTDLGRRYNRIYIGG